jgi:hypothetical protein
MHGNAGTAGALLTDAGGEGEEVDEPKEEEGALELQRPEHNVGCREEQSQRYGGKVEFVLEE